MFSRKVEGEKVEKSAEDVEAWLVELQRGKKKRLCHFCKESVVSGELELKNQL